MMSNRHADKLHQVNKQLNIQITTNNKQLIQSQEIIILAVKPQDLINLIKSFAPYLPNPSPVFISIAAGIQIKLLQTHLIHSPIIRAMPNTATQYQCSATGLYTPKTVSKMHRLWAEQIFKALGTITWLSEEHLLDVVTAIAGSGPAYFYLFMDYFTQIAIKEGLTAAQARSLVTQTSLGAATLAQKQPDISLQELKEKVTSKGGTTAAALTVLESSPLKTNYQEAIEAAIKRAKELNMG